MKYLKKYQIFESDFGYPIDKVGGKLPGYKETADRLKKLGHIKRSENIEKWIKEKEERLKKEIEEKKERLKKENELLRKDELSKFPPFKLKFYRKRWNSTSQINEEDFLGEGLFYVEPSFSSDWLGDMMNDHEAYVEGLNLPIDFGTSPANEETEIAWQEIKSKCPSLKEQEHEGVAYNTRMFITLFDSDSYVITNENKCYWESSDNCLFVLDSRAEAIRFKKLLVESLEDKNQWGKNKWSPEGMYGHFIKFFQKDLEWRRKSIEAGRQRVEQYFKPEHMPIIANKVKTGLSINDLYRD